MIAYNRESFFGSVKSALALTHGWHVMVLQSPALYFIQQFQDCLKCIFGKYANPLRRAVQKTFTDSLTRADATNVWTNRLKETGAWKIDAAYRIDSIVPNESNSLESAKIISQW